MKAILLAALATLPVAPDRPVIVVFFGTECPLAKLYAPRVNQLYEKYSAQGVSFVGVNANATDMAADVAKFSADHRLQFPLVKDDQHLAEALGATRQMEVFLLDRQWRVVYHGRVDDQYRPGQRLAKPTRNDLDEALADLLAGRPVAVPSTEVLGCFLDLPAETASDSEITYADHVAPILQQHCVACHSPGRSGPFSLLTYENAVAWAETMRERVDEGAMPPWGADPRFGHFRNQRVLTSTEKQTLDRWCTTGMAAGRPREPLTAPKTDWQIGQPDLVIGMPKAFAVPAEGTLEYQIFEIDPDLKSDVWITAAEIRPGKASVVHHASVFLAPPGTPAGMTRESGSLGNFVLATYTPGTEPATYPEGMAKLLPAGTRLRFVMHYVPNGTPQLDQTQIGLRIASQAPAREVATKLIDAQDFSIPAGQSDFVVERAWQANVDVLLLSMFPHMHLRGHSFTYTVEFPSGEREILLHVPHYNFEWQDRYVLAEPRVLPKGTILRVTAHYDNSAANRVNPDPTQQVDVGTQSTDEMFNGYFDCAAASPVERPVALVGTLAIVGMWLVCRRRPFDLR